MSLPERESAGEPHLVHTLVKERQAGVLIADERTLLDEAAEHLSLDHERVEALVGAVAALQEAYVGVKRRLLALGAGRWEGWDSESTYMTLKKSGCSAENSCVGCRARLCEL